MNVRVGAGRLGKGSFTIAVNGNSGSKDKERYKEKEALLLQAVAIVEIGIKSGIRKRNRYHL
jgi:hypothetical protein